MGNGVERVQQGAKGAVGAEEAEGVAQPQHCEEEGRGWKIVHMYIWKSHNDLMKPVILSVARQGGAEEDKGGSRPEKEGPSRL